ncbi:hypothetical protein V1264_021677 [Littorina saxatilis]|uniref:Mitochondrial import inner membrane translocase subunit n=1 Tax=Littorina saxatilis TaxID=31220 RepID=A0AAN9AIP5_9CAEN
MAQQMNEAQMKFVQELEMEMMADMFNKMSTTCQKKCIPPKYRESELTKGEAVCLDRCVAKYLDIHDRIGRKLTSLSMADEDATKKLQTQLQK